MSGRRNLQFDNWDEVIADVRSLEEGYVQHRQWNLEQACRHLEDWVRYPMDGFPKQSIFIRSLLWVMRKLFGKKTLRTIIEDRRMKDGMPTAPQTVHQASSVESEKDAVESLVSTIERFRDYGQPLYDSPFFGPTDHDTASRLHLVHAAHHLSWLEPKHA